MRLNRSIIQLDLFKNRSRRTIQKMGNTWLWPLVAEQIQPQHFPSCRAHHSNFLESARFKRPYMTRELPLLRVSNYEKWVIAVLLLCVIWSHYENP